MTETTTRDRLVTEAMRLFSEQGYRATSVAQIEAAAGLAAGSGALYHHFKSKESLLEAGIDRQLDRRRAMHDIRAMFAGLGDLRTELTLLGRYLLNVIDDESQLLQIAARTPTDRAARLNDAYAALIDGLYTELDDWIHGWAPTMDSAESRTIATLGINALLGKRATAMFFHAEAAEAPDDRYLAEWTAILADRISNSR
ncbi:TetR family transcriptional regulator [Mycolicibacterium mageritense DSM 44476 = CIP 104973]|uniref:Transcriptional regulator, TetR family protein n=1 Tax=Mycolicibacterium mageritense TaxID=53462 RepID=A0ABM7I117_MYCME|nr:helix-turn-helix domain-containing protein [Mycolicibacterium mageritense]MCC9186024.1 TetR/AcrR family transcriptional regulator [Mycolicibacterium mageritense]BBX36579.1 putative transcriptional regulator, TetR family protein [Mycolicibacterium mageritense]CDO24683.1 TetR family transcriptional regulator [Mycolicibacterium mageritense DSM 44476 = CIP 104973]